MNCERCRERMSDAAARSLSARKQIEFDAHVHGCAKCRERFDSVCALLEAIDRGVVARVADEPSPELFAHVRRRIEEEATPDRAMQAWWLPAAACAAIVILSVTVWMMWPKGSRPGQLIKIAPASNSPTVANHEAPNRASMGEGATAPNHPSSVAPLRRMATHNQRRIEREPEVLVPPGEAEAVLELAAVLQSGKLDGVKLMADLRKADQPIEIKPLVITPLASSAQAVDAASKPDGNGAPKNFVSGESAREIVR